MLWAITSHPKKSFLRKMTQKAKVTEAEDMKDGKNTHGTNILTANRKMEIELASRNGVKRDFIRTMKLTSIR